MNWTMQRQGIFNAIRMDRAFAAFNFKASDAIGGVPQKPKQQIWPNLDRPMRLSLDYLPSSIYLPKNVEYSLLYSYVGL